MNRCVISPQALDDMRGIWDYIGIEQGNPRAANDQLDGFKHKFASLARQSLMGQLREDLRPGLRIFAADNYIILYYPLDNGIEVAGVVHAARHIEWLFEKGEREFCQP